LVATLNKAFGTLQAVKSSKGKTSPKCYQALRNKVLADTANITFLDKTGREYPSLASLPEHLQGWFKKTFLYKKVQEATKRPAQDSSDMDSSPQKEKKDDQPPKKRKVEEKKVVQVDPVTPKHAPKPKPRKAAKKKVVEPDNSISEVTMGDSQPNRGDFNVTSVPWLIEPTGENKVFVNTVNGIASATLSRGSDEDAVRLVYDHAIETSNAFVNAMQVFLDAGEIEIAPGNALVFSQKANERFASVVEAAGGNSGPFTGARAPSAAHHRK
jgi:outer membrane biosynthesis protein TonB